MKTPQTSANDRAVRANLELAALALIAVACVVNLFVPVGAGRTIVTLLAALAVPGAAVMIRMPVSDPAQGVALAVGLSLTVEVVVTLVMVWTGWWHPVAAAAALAGVTAAVLAADLVCDVRCVP
jgi:uncharacterized membrane protein